MKHLLSWLTLLAAVLPASAQTSYILQAPSAEASDLAARYGLTVVRGDDIEGQHYSVVVVPSGTSAQTLAQLGAEPGVGGVDEDSPLAIPERQAQTIASSTAALQNALQQTSSVSYFGAMVR